MWCEIMQKAWSNIGEVPYGLFKSSVKLQVTLAGKIEDLALIWEIPNGNSNMNWQTATNNTYTFSF